MKRKILLSVFSIVLAVCCFALVACGDTDKASQNKDFVSFRKKIVTILKDNGVFVNDYDNLNVFAQKSSFVASASLLQASSVNRSIADIVIRQEYEVPSENYEFMLKQVFGMSLRMSLCLGDGISNYFSEKNFFDISVQLDANNYLKVTENGNVNTVWSYNDYNGKQFDKIDINFTSATDYSFTSKTIRPTTSQDEGDNIYWQGNSDKEFLMLEAGGAPQIVYTPNGQDFYATEDAKIVDECYEILGRDIFDVEEQEFTSLKPNAKYSFTEAQLNALSDKYFKDIQSTSAPQEKGIRYEEINGKQVAVEYSAVDAETVVTIPSDVQYISSGFRVYDWNGTVTSLVIPSSVKQVITSDGSEAKSIVDFYFTLFDDKKQTDRLFDNITVQQGSPLFKAGEGNLTLTDGRVVYVLDKPLTSFDLNVLAAVAVLSDNVTYSKVYKLNANEVTLKMSEYKAVLDKYQLDEMTDTLNKVFNRSSVSVINYVVDRQDTVRLDIALKTDLIFNVSSTLEFDRYNGANVCLVFTNATQNNLDVTVNIDRSAAPIYFQVEPKQPEHKFLPDDPSTWDEPEYVHEDSVHTTFNIGMEFDLYKAMYTDKITCDDKNSEIKGLPSTQGSKFDYLDVTLNDSCDAASVTLKEGAPANVTIPDRFYGIDVAGFNITSLCADLKTTVKVSNTLTLSITGVNGSGVVFNNPDFVLDYDGTYDELREKFYYYYTENPFTTYDVVFTAKCTDTTETLKVGWAYSAENPDNEEFFKWTATVDYNGKTLMYKINDYDGGKRLGYDDDNTAYFMYNKDSDIFIPVYFDPSEGVNRVNFPAGQDGSYTLYSLPFGESQATFTQNVDGRTYDLSVRYNVKRAEDESLHWPFCMEILTVTGTVNGQPIGNFMFDNYDGYDENKLVSNIVMFEIEEEGTPEFGHYEVKLDYFNNTLQVLTEPENKD